jgi:hypothetical protein
MTLLVIMDLVFFDIKTYIRMAPIGTATAARVPEIPIPYIPQIMINAKKTFIHLF